MVRTFPSQSPMLWTLVGAGLFSALLLALLWERPVLKAGPVSLGQGRMMTLTVAHPFWSDTPYGTLAFSLSGRASEGSLFFPGRLGAAVNLYEDSAGLHVLTSALETYAISPEGVMRRAGSASISDGMRFIGSFFHDRSARIMVFASPAERAECFSALRDVLPGEIARTALTDRPCPSG